MRKIDWIVLHCTAGPQNQKVENILNYWKSIGWKAPGYHHMIKADGTIVDTWPIEKPSNGVKGYNANSIHIAYIGGVEVKKGVNDKGKPIDVMGKALDNRTEKQIESQIFLVKTYHELFPNAIIQGHRDFSEDKNRDGIISPNEWMKTCPSFSVKTWLSCIGIKQ